MTKWPPIIRFLVSVFNSARTPRFIYEPFWKSLLYIPIFPNVKRLKEIYKAREEYNFVIISGRRGGTPMIEQMLLDYGCFYLFNDVVTPRECATITTPKFKEKVCKAMDVDWYFDDNRYTVWYLRKKEIKAIRL